MHQNGTTPGILLCDDKTTRPKDYLKNNDFVDVYWEGFVGLSKNEPSSHVKLPPDPNSGRPTRTRNTPNSTTTNTMISTKAKVDTTANNNNNNNNNNKSSHKPKKNKTNEVIVARRDVDDVAKHLHNSTTVPEYNGYGVDGRFFVPGMPVRVKLNPKRNTLRNATIISRDRSNLIIQLSDNSKVEIGVDCVIQFVEDYFERVIDVERDEDDNITSCTVTWVGYNNNDDHNTTKELLSDQKLLETSGTLDISLLEMAAINAPPDAFRLKVAHERSYLMGIAEIALTDESQFHVGPERPLNSPVKDTSLIVERGRIWIYLSYFKDWRPFDVIALLGKSSKRPASRGAGANMMKGLMINFSFPSNYQQVPRTSW